MDIESVLRNHLKNIGSLPDVEISENSENRIMVMIPGADDHEHQFVLVGNTFIEWPIKAEKPPTQRAEVQGFETFKTLGER